jgi:hypothetical protein
MTMAARSTVVGVFEDANDAERAVDKLRDAGFTADNIGYAGHGEHKTVDSDKAENTAAGAATGAVGGGVVGGVLGAVAAGLIPGIGPIIGAGILAATVGGAAAGAAAGGLLGALTGLGVPEEEAKYYEGEFKSGRTIVSVRASGRYDEAVRILRGEGAYDIESRGSTGVAGSPRI